MYVHLCIVYYYIHCTHLIIHTRRVICVYLWYMTTTFNYTYTLHTNARAVQKCVSGQWLLWALSLIIIAVYYSVQNNANYDNKRRKSDQEESWSLGSKQVMVADSLKAGWTLGWATNAINPMPTYITCHARPLPNPTTSWPTAFSSPMDIDETKKGWQYLSQSRMRQFIVSPNM